MQYSIFSYQSIPKETSIFRLDAEFYHPQILAAKKTIRSKRNVTLRKINAKIIHPTEIKRTYTEEGLQILLAQNIRDNYLDFSAKVFMPFEVEKFLLRNQLKSGDIVITRSGANYGQCAVYLGTPPKIFACADDLVVRAGEISTKYLSTFFNTYIGKFLIESCKYGGSQPHIAPQTLYDIPVYSPSKNFSDFIDICIVNSLKFIEQSKVIYHQVQTLLLAELGLVNWHPKHRLTFVKNYSDTEGSERIDAEHFQPKYDQLMEFVFSNSLYTKEIAEIHTRNSRGLQPKYVQDGSVDVVTSKHILEDGLDYENFDKTTQENWDEQKRARIKTGDILTYTTGANIGRTAMYSSDRRALASNHVNVLTIKDERPEYVAFVMNSIVGRLQTEKMCAGSAQVELYPRDIENFVIPFIAKEKQLEIQQKVTESFRLREQSKHLLESAKRAVEIAIEQDEEIAIEWLEKQMEG